MALKLNPIAGKFDLVDSKFRYQATDELRFKSSAVNKITGNSGGLNIRGGTATGDNLTLSPHNQAFDSDNLGRIVFDERATFNKNIQIDHDNGAFLKIGSFTWLHFTGVHTAQTNMTTLTDQVVLADHTVTYERTQVFSTVTLFDARPTIQPTGAGTDTSTEWRMFFALPTFAPLLSTAVNATTNRFGGYVAAPQAAINASSHASATSTIETMFGIYASGGVSNRATVNTYNGLWARTVGVSGTGSIGTANGLKIDSITAGTNRYGANIETPSTSGATAVRTLWLSSNADNTTDEGGLFFGASANARFFRSGAGAFTIIGSGGGANGVGGQLVIANRYNNDASTRNGLILTAGATSDATGSIVINHQGSTVSTITAGGAALITMSATTHNFSNGSAAIQLGGNLALERSSTILRIGEGFSGGIVLRGNSSTAPLTFGTSADVTLYRSAADILKTDDSFEIAANLRFTSALDATVVGLPAGRLPVVLNGVTYYLQIFNA